MIDKVTDTISYIKKINKKKPSAGRIKTHLLRAGNETNELPIESLEISLVTIELVDDAYKVKQTQDRNWLKTQSEVTSQCALFSQSETLIIPETQKSPEYATLLFL